MRIRWENIVAVGLLVFVVYLLVRGGEPVRALVTQACDPPSWEPQNQAVNVMVLALMLVAIVAIVRLLVSGRK